MEEHRRRTAGPVAYTSKRANKDVDLAYTSSVTSLQDSFSENPTTCNVIETGGIFPADSVWVKSRLPIFNGRKGDKTSAYNFLKAVVSDAIRLRKNLDATVDSLILAFLQEGARIWYFARKHQFEGTFATFKELFLEPFGGDETNSHATYSNFDSIRVRVSGRVC